MKTLKRVRFVLVLFLFTLGFSTHLYADETAAATDTLSASDSHSDEQILSSAERWKIKRQVMSKPGVMYDMANMTDNGYVWKNDVLWEGEALPANEKWYTAGFFFKRVGYKKGVWLQYAFQIDESSGTLNGFKRSYGTRTFR